LWWLLLIPLILLIAGGIVFLKIRQKMQQPQDDKSMPEQIQVNFDPGTDLDLTRPLIEGVRPGHLAHGVTKIPVLVINDISQPHKRYEIKVEATVELGRSPNLPGITINYDKKISRRHCSVTQRRGVLWIEDLGSFNKTFVNDEALDEPRMLKDNDILTLGKTKFFVKIEEH
jgi:hypothetical protein